MNAAYHARSAATDARHALRMSRFDHVVQRHFARGIQIVAVVVKRAAASAASAAGKAPEAPKEKS